MKEFNGKYFDAIQLKQLGEVLIATNSSGLRDIIALKFIEANHSGSEEYMVTAIKKNIHTKFVSTLIYACSQFDCAEHFQLFVDLLILKRDMSFVDAYYAIVAIKKPIYFGDREYGVNKLRAFLECCDDDYPLFSEIRVAIKTIEQMNVGLKE
ncbi:hypothetical protein [Flavihumibacter petaseus]|uniref:Uncharacterized protein n=1 Tax=Flavihumibacter petaseus NBRC 106054 TaxID=1220578 RepID=A0A0E9MWS1_9BACT|nr:hypothetical protein [Flavihumibacter petaseus]GAO41943.1 hypothetical protein FPE01S_01_09580 [Flavihumibacter petaseus NBRC 106054]